MTEPEVSQDPTSAETGHFRWEIIVVVMAAAMLLLAVQLWRRMDRVDPRERCVGAYEGVHTAVDSTLVDRMPVRSPAGGERTTCGALRAAGQLEGVTRRQPTGGGMLPPRPQ